MSQTGSQPDRSFRVPSAKPLHERKKYARSDVSHQSLRHRSGLGHYPNSSPRLANYSPSFYLPHIWHTWLILWVYPSEISLKYLPRVCRHSNPCGTEDRNSRLPIMSSISRTSFPLAACLSASHLCTASSHTAPPLAAYVYSSSSQLGTPFPPRICISE